MWRAGGEGGHLEDSHIQDWAVAMRLPSLSSLY